jgi:hypothetical protein
MLFAFIRGRLRDRFLRASQPGWPITALRRSRLSAGHSSREL